MVALQSCTNLKHAYILKIENCGGESTWTLVNTAGAKEQRTTAAVRMIERTWKEGRKKKAQQISTT